MESEVTHLPLAHRAMAWFEANKKQTLWGCGILAGVSLIVAFIVYHRSEAEVAASQALSNVALSQLTGGSRGDLAEAYLKVAAAHPGSQAASRAVLLAAGGLFVEGKYAEAKTQFERFTKDYKESPFRGEALLGVAACLDAQGNAAAAASAYKDLIDRHPSDAVLPQARFALARLYEAQNKPELARSQYEDVERSSPFTSLGNEAGMRLEELKQKYPNLATPVAAAPTNVLQIPPKKN